MINLNSMRSIFYRIGFNTFIQVFGKGISIILGFITVGLLTRYLGQEGFGNFTLVFAYLSLFGIIADFGLQLTMVRELAKKTAPQSIYGTYFWLKVILVILASIFAIICLLVFPYSKFLKIGIIIASVAVGIGVLNTYGTVIFQANLRMDLVTFIETLAKIVTTVLILVFIFLKLGFYSFFNAVLLGNLVGSILILWLVKRLVAFNLSFDFNLAKKIIYKSLPIGFLTLFSLVYFKIDTVLLSIFRKSEEVGVYSLAYKVIENILVLWGFYMASAYPLLSKFTGEKLKKGVMLWRSSVFLAVISGVLIIILGYIFSPLIIRVLGGEEFSPSVLPLRILLFSIPLLFLNNLYFYSFLVREKTRVLLLAGGFSLLVNFFSNLILIPRLGYVGAGLAMLITTTSLWVAYFCFNSKYDEKGFIK